MLPGALWYCLANGSTLWAVWIHTTIPATCLYEPVFLEHANFLDKPQAESVLSKKQQITVYPNFWTAQNEQEYDHYATTANNSYQMLANPNHN